MPVGYIFDPSLLHLSKFYTKGEGVSTPVRQVCGGCTYPRYIHHPLHQKIKRDEHQPWVTENANRYSHRLHDEHPNSGKQRRLLENFSIVGCRCALLGREFVTTAEMRHVVLVTLDRVDRFL